MWEPGGVFFFFYDLTSIDLSPHYLLLTSVSVAQSANGTDDSLLRGGFHSSPPSSSLMVQLSSIPMLSTCFNKLFSLLQVHHVQVRAKSGFVSCSYRVCPKI